MIAKLFNISLQPGKVTKDFKVNVLCDIFQIHPPSNGCPFVWARGSVHHGCVASSSQDKDILNQPIFLASECMSSDCGRKLEYPEGTHANPKTCQRYTRKQLKLLFKNTKTGKYYFLIPLWLLDCIRLQQLQITDIYNDSKKDDKEFLHLICGRAWS